MPPKTKLFVGMLPPDITEGALRKIFENHGTVVECSIMGSYAFVHMKSDEEAMIAIEALNQYDIGGYKISVEQSTGERRSGGRGGGGGGRGRGGFRGGRGGGGFRDSYGGGRGGGRGGGGPMRGGRGGRMPPYEDRYRAGPYDRSESYDRRPLPPPHSDRYGPLPPPPMRNGGGYYSDYDRGHPLDRRPLPPYSHDPYDRYDSYDHRRDALSAGLPEARARDHRPLPSVPAAYERRSDLYDDHPRDPYYHAPQRDLLYPPRAAAPARAQSPPRYGAPPIQRY